MDFIISLVLGSCLFVLPLGFVPAVDSVGAVAPLTRPGRWQFRFLETCRNFWIGRALRVSSLPAYQVFVPLVLLSFVVVVDGQSFSAPLAPPSSSQANTSGVFYSITGSDGSGPVNMSYQTSQLDYSSMLSYLESTAHNIDINTSEAAADIIHLDAYATGHMGSAIDAISAATTVGNGSLATMNGNVMSLIGVANSIAANTSGNASHSDVNAVTTAVTGLTTDVSAFQAANHVDLSLANGHLTTIGLSLNTANGQLLSIVNNTAPLDADLQSILAALGYIPSLAQDATLQATNGILSSIAAAMGSVAQDSTLQQTNAKLDTIDGDIQDGNGDLDGIAADVHKINSNLQDIHDWWDPTGSYAGGIGDTFLDPPPDSSDLKSAITTLTQGASKSALAGGFYVDGSEDSLAVASNLSGFIPTAPSNVSAPASTQLHVGGHEVTVLLPTLAPDIALSIEAAIFYMASGLFIFIRFRSLVESI